MNTNLAEMSLEDLAKKHSTLQGEVAEVAAEMGKYAEKHKMLQGEVSEVSAEMKSRLGVQEEKKPRKKKDSSGEKSGPTLKEIVKTILTNNPQGLELKGIVTEVKAMIDKGEYTSKAKNKSAVVSQALDSLKEDNLVAHNRESKVYSLAVAAA